MNKCLICKKVSYRKRDFCRTCLRYLWYDFTPLTSFYERMVLQNYRCSLDDVFNNMIDAYDSIINKTYIDTYSTNKQLILMWKSIKEDYPKIMKIVEYQKVYQLTHKRYRKKKKETLTN